jgi:glycosyltransferase involved in cell wall biosynthesis
MLLPISVIVVVKNAEKTIEKCLQSIQCNYPAEIIIVDGESTDSTLSIARKYTTKIYSDEGKGVSVAHQIGLEKAEQEYVSYVDADIELPDNGLTVMLDELKARGLANIQARRISGNLNTYWERGQDYATHELQSRKRGGLSASILVRKTALEIGFDPFISICGDDFDFITRLSQCGYKTESSDVKAIHHHRSDFKSYTKQRQWYGRGQVFVIYKHGLKNIALWPLANPIYNSLRCLVKLKFKYIPFFIVGGIYQLKGMALGIGELRTTLKKRKSGK